MGPGIGILTSPLHQSHGHFKTTALTELPSWINFNSPESPFKNQFSRISSSAREWSKPSFFSSIFQWLVSTLWNDFRLRPLFSTPKATILSRQPSELMGPIMPEFPNSFRLPVYASGMHLLPSHQSVLPPDSLCCQHLSSFFYRMGSQILHCTDRTPHSYDISWMSSFFLPTPANVPPRKFLQMLLLHLE